MPNRKLLVSRFGGPEVMRVETEATVPVPAAGEVRIRVEASSLVFTDMLIRRNLYPLLKLTPPLVLGYDMVGRIDAVGPGVAGWAVGDRVADLTQVGGAQDYLCLPAALLVRVPEAVSAVEAETMVLSYLTAYQGLTRLGALRTGSRVLVLGASGAVGLAALDLCRALGATATGVASGRRRALVEGHDATFLAYDAAGHAAALTAAAGAGGFDIILDAAGDAPYGRLARLLSPRGRLVALGFSSALGRARGRWGGLPRLAGQLRLGAKVASILTRQALTKGSGRYRFYDIAGTRRMHPDWFRADLTALFALLEARRIAPLISGTFTLDTAHEAHARIEAGDVTGRLVLRVSGDMERGQRPD